MSRTLKTAALLTAALAANACSSDRPAHRHEQPIGMPNPASAYCIKLGGKLDFVQGEHGTYGLCTLPSGEQIEEWALFRRDHHSAP